jgi:hypothetical protein
VLQPPNLSTSFSLGAVVMQACFPERDILGRWTANLRVSYSLRLPPPARLAALTFLATSLPSWLVHSQTRNVVAHSEVLRHETSGFPQSALTTGLSPSSSVKVARPSQLVVGYQNCKLSVSADNVALGDILRAVSKETGIAIVVPAGADDPVVMHLGPAPIVEVLDSLLRPSRFDYAILGPASDPSQAVRVIFYAERARRSVAPQVQGPAQAMNGVVDGAAKSISAGSQPGSSAGSQQDRASARAVIGMGVPAASRTVDPTDAQLRRQEAEDRIEQQRSSVQQGLLKWLGTRSGQGQEDPESQGQQSPP